LIINFAPTGKLDGNLKPDMGSLTLSSLNFLTQASVNDPSMVMKLAQEMAENLNLRHLTPV
jgi:hypothetical protein